MDKDRPSPNKLDGEPWARSALRTSVSPRHAKTRHSRGCRNHSDSCPCQMPYTVPGPIPHQLNKSVPLLAHDFNLPLLNLSRSEIDFLLNPSIWRRPWEKYVQQ